MRPPCDEGHPDTALVALALEAAELAVAPEKLGVGATLLMGSVVAGEYHERVVGQPLVSQQLQDFAHILVEPGNHAGKLGMRMHHGIVA